MFQEIKTVTLKEQFIEQMENMILSGELKIGEKLPPERELAKMLNVSRSVVNSGIVELARIGFLKIIPRQGTYVANYKKDGKIDILVSMMKNSNVSNEYIHSVLELRKIMMDLTLESAIKNMNDKDIKELENLSVKLKKSQTYTEAAQYIFDFDHYLTSISDNLLLPLIFSSFQKPNIMLFERYVNLHGIDKMYERNLLLIQCFERKDIKRAQKIMNTSIDKTIHGETKIYNT